MSKEKEYIVTINVHTKAKNEDEAEDKAWTYLCFEDRMGISFNTREAKEEEKILD